VSVAGRPPGVDTSILKQEAQGRRRSNGRPGCLPRGATSLTCAITPCRWCSMAQNWWASRESNTAPTDYESAALTRHELEARNRALRDAMN
jgi:hypothetical protein